MEVKPGYKQTEVGVIPEEWEVSSVRQKGEVLTGKALAVNAPGRQRPYLRTKNVFDGRIDIDDVLTMPMNDEQFAQFQIRNGDVLLNEGQSIELVGRCAMYQDEYPEPCAIQNALLRFRARAGVSEKFASYLFRHCQHTGVFARIALQTTSVAHLGGSRFERLHLAWPTEPEQRAIATALNDMDGLLGGLDRLIAKKRDLKQAAMQQLLTGQTRLPGFHGEWEVKRLGDVLEVRHGKSQHGITVSDGKYPILASGGEIGRTNSYIYDRPSVLIGRKGTIDSPQYVETPFWSVDTLFFTEISSEADAKFVFYKFTMIRWRSYNEASGVPSLNAKTIENIEVTLPPLLEQTAIASVLSEMDGELAALEQRREKTRVLKQAMMQELLTGRTRLV
jgi:type I restriction enzyme S subunit